MKLLKIITPLLMSLSVSMGRAQEVKIHPSCEPIVAECLNIIEAADRAIEAKTYESALQKQALKEATTVNNRLQDELNASRAWYRQPEFVAPMSAFLVLILEASLKGGK